MNASLSRDYQVGLWCLIGEKSIDEVMVTLAAEDIIHDARGKVVVLGGVVKQYSIIGIIACCNGGINLISYNPDPVGEMVFLLFVIVASIGIKVSKYNGILGRFTDECLHEC